MTEPSAYPPPDPNTRAPAIPPPPGACDCQVHVFGGPGYPYAATRVYEPHPATLEMALAMHRALGIERGVLVQPTVYGTDNRYMLECLGQLGGRYAGVAVLDDTVSEAELDRMHRAGVRGVRFNFAKFLKITPSRDTVDRLTARMADRGWHAVVHVVEEDILEHADYFRTLPVPVVIDHMGHLDSAGGTGQPAMRILLGLLDTGKFWMKVSNGDRMSAAGAPFADVVPFGRAFVEAAPERVIWGTDWPHVLYRRPRMVNDGALLDLFYRYAADEATRRRILVDNPAILYDFVEGGG